MDGVKKQGLSASVLTEQFRFTESPTMPISFIAEANLPVRAEATFAEEAVLLVAGAVFGWLSKLLLDVWAGRRSYDQRLRLEKEYSLYSDVWDKLFELRRTLGNAIGDFTHPADQPSDDVILATFNAYQAAVRKSEPFMVTAVHDPAREIAKLGRQMATDIGRVRHIERRAVENPHPTLIGGQDHGDRRELYDERNEAAFDEFEKHFEAVKVAIRHRVGPP